MPLTPEEEQQLREQIRASLEAREQQRSTVQHQEDQGRQQQLEERLRQQIAEEEEERFYRERGYVQHKNRQGIIEWVTPEEAERRAGRRSKRKSSGRRKIRQRNQILQWALNIALVTVALGVFYYLLRYNPGPARVNHGNIIVTSDVPGAHIYLDGTEKRLLFTPDTLRNLPAGAHFLAIYKDGYTAWPPMQRIQVEANGTARAEFTLKSAGLLGQISVSANLEKFTIYVDGIAVPALPESVIEVPAGYRVITVVKEGYLANPHYQRVLVKAGELTPLRFTFDPGGDIGYLDISSNLNSAYVFIDNRFSGLKANGGPFPLPAGVYEVRVCQNGYSNIPQAELLRIIPGQTHALSFHLQPEAARDTLHIATATPGAGIIIDGHWQPVVTPARDLYLSPGIHFFNFMRDGRLYAAQELQINSEPNNQKLLSYDF